MRRTISFALMGLGVVACGLGVASATVWKMSDTLTASHTLASNAAAAVADPGVMEIAADTVTIRVISTQESPVVLAVGRDTDVAGWVGDGAVEHLTGLSSTGTGFTTSGLKGDGILPSAADSDLWIEQEKGNGSASLTWKRHEGRWSLLVSAERENGGLGKDVKVEMTWPQVVTTPYLIPLTAGGGAAILCGLALLVVDIRTGRKRAAGAGAAAAGDGRPSTPDTRAAAGTATATASEIPEKSGAAADLAPSTSVKVTPLPSRRRAAHAGGLIDAPEPAESHDAYRPAGAPAQPPTTAPERSTVAQRMQDSMRAVDLGEGESTSEITVTRRQLREAERARVRGGSSAGGPDAATAAIPAIEQHTEPAPVPRSAPEEPPVKEERPAEASPAADEAMSSSPYTQPAQDAVDQAADRWRRVWSVIPTDSEREAAAGSHTPPDPPQPEPESAAPDEPESTAPDDSGDKGDRGDKGGKSGRGGKGSKGGKR